MSKTTEIAFPRREFIRGAASAACAGLLASSGLGQIVIPRPPTHISASLGYWNGDHLVSANSLPLGDPTLSAINLTMIGYSLGGSLNAVDTQSFVASGGTSQTVTFQAWTAAPQGAKQVRFVMAPDPAKGIALVAHTGTETLNIPLIFGGEKSAKLKEGTYVLLPGAVDWLAYQFDPSQSDAPLSKPGAPPESLPQYLVIQIVRG